MLMLCMHMLRVLLLVLCMHMLRVLLMCAVTNVAGAVYEYAACVVDVCCY